MPLTARLFGCFVQQTSRQTRTKSAKLPTVAPSPDIRASVLCRKPIALGPFSINAANPQPFSDSKVS